ncbi:DUF2207 domain-containing protein [Flavobacterium branchiicola]|uniref:DUF2207 domain-containing protein n=1 Tax=Flavobacterium branchiicola TaxID=1114875 RepID=A0ABV9PAW2_9FLAO|nr:DUF2207 domain-containing protein [Flavobacterium branchiicola]MBS7252530.1 DUF2207 domain-containing protein [Flavobacterium branchiicola]
MFLKKIFFVLLTLFFCQLQAQERILDFDVKIQIEKSGDIRVLENITIKAEGNAFKHGLLRTLPLNRKDKDGNNIDVKYTIDSIKKDGITEDYFTEEEQNVWKIYIGNKDVELESGVYKYQISYHVPFQIGYFDYYDELYWNVTGNGWDFPIDKVSCQFYLPSENNKFENLHCYSGPEGSTASNCISSLNDNKTVVSFSAVHLKENEGLTVAASFAKGIVDPPTFGQKSNSFYKQIKTNLWSAIFGIGMMFFFFFNWRKYGKDPVKKTIIPEFLPPFDWSPALVGYVYHRKLEDKIYMSSVINSAIKGAIKISSEIESGIFVNSKKYEIEVLDKQAKSLSLEESDIISSFSKKVKIKIEDTNYKIFEKAYSKWIEAVESQIKLEEIYLNNTRLKWVGFAVLVIAGLAFELLSKSEGYINFPFYTGFVCALSGLTYWFTRKVVGTGWLILRGILAFFLYPMAVGLFFMSIPFLNATQIIVIAFIVVIYIIYAVNLGKFTEKGAEVFNRLEGFKLYLEAAEKDRMNMLNPPELTPLLFEKLLPYAIALGVEIKWGKQFEEILELAKYNPEWYHGTDPFYRQPTLFLSDLRNSVNNAAVDPTSRSSSSSSGSSGSWSSGSSGGGSSGGGGGGGGGGGW